MAVEAGNQLVVRELLNSKAKEQLKIVKAVCCLCKYFYIVSFKKTEQRCFEF